LSLRIPLTKDQTLQVEFHEVERRLRRLEKGLGVTPGGSVVRVASTTGGGSGSASLGSITARIEAIEAAIASLPTISDIPDFGPVGGSASRGLVPSPGTAEPPTGVAQHVLTEDNDWGFPLRGLIGVATPGDETAACDVVNVNASLHVAGALSVDGVICNDIAISGTLDGGTP
jgi:hypothetical protein